MKPESTKGWHRRGLEWRRSLEVESQLKTLGEVKGRQTGKLRERESEGEGGGRQADRQTDREEQEREGKADKYVHNIRQTE